MARSSLEKSQIIWTKCSERMPTRADADDYGEIWWCGAEVVRRETLREVLSWDFTKLWNLNGSWARTGIQRPSPPTCNNSPSASFLSLPSDEYWSAWHDLGGAAIELRCILRAMDDGTATNSDKDVFGRSILNRIQQAVQTLMR